MRVVARSAVFAVVFVLALVGCGPEIPPGVEEALSDIPDVVDFNQHVRPILSDRCFACHGPDANARKSDLRLDLESGAFAALSESPGEHAFVGGSLGRSEAIARVLSSDPERIMPPPDANLTLSDREKALLVRWVDQGAEWQPFWAFRPIERPDSPAGSNPIDAFVSRRLEEEGLRMSPEADKGSLIRRASFHLTGLPPQVGRLEEFLEDNEESAYEQLVDELLSSPQYGERMANEWLDVARYADTYGYTVDRYRESWHWRDWVIDSFNENRPFDEFVTWQLAGDLLENPTREQVLATGFNRNHAQNQEGGIVPEEFRTAYVMDRTETFGTAFLGMTMNCARCHDHKYDPITHDEYYELFSFFNNVDEAGQVSFDETLPAPTLLLTPADVEERLAVLKDQEAEQSAALTAYESARLKEMDGTTRLPKRPSRPVATYSFESPTIKRIRENANSTLDGTYIDPVTKQLSSLDPVPVAGYRGNGLLLNGDDAPYFPKVGVFDRANAFTIGLWVNIPKDLTNGVIFHKNDGGVIYQFKGYQLSLDKDGKADVRLAHSFPYNSINIVSEAGLDRDRWLHLAVTYDGSSTASGLDLFIDGRRAEVEVLRDNLYKDILLKRDVEPGLKIGGQMRSKGFAGGRVDELAVYDRKLTEPEVARLADPENDLSDFSSNDLALASLRSSDSAYAEMIARLEKTRRQMNRLAEDIPEAMVIAEMDEPRQAFVLNRGEYDDPIREVFPATPRQIMPFPDSLRKDRLGLAQWLTHPDNPSLARVTVNRFWAQYFGKGLVKTTGDFGVQGELPSHPALLDWLAAEFVDSGWDVKHIQRLIVTSRTYRQASQVSPDLLEKDPENRLLARGPSHRLSAEMLRDHALATGGLLVDSVGGPSVRPYQPDGLWSVNSGRYEQSEGADLYRRSMYTLWKRTVPPPTMQLFDAPSRSYCVVRRQKTSSPLQALALLNDPTFLEAARKLAEQSILMAGPDLSDQLTHTFKSLTTREPTPDEMAVLTDLYNKRVLEFATEEATAEAYLDVGSSERDRQLDVSSLAAHAAVASAVINTDAAITIR